ncbi:hypothetical protein J2847_005365 [Azospirillum agricola]|nr:hypothetical protein [Azospirillum agricola]
MTGTTRGRIRVMAFVFPCSRRDARDSLVAPFYSSPRGAKLIAAPFMQ